MNKRILVTFLMLCLLIPMLTGCHINESPANASSDTSNTSHEKIVMDYSPDTILYDNKYLTVSFLRTEYYEDYYETGENYFEIAFIVQNKTGGLLCVDLENILINDVRIDDPHAMLTMEENEKDELRIRVQNFEIAEAEKGVSSVAFTLMATDNVKVKDLDTYSVIFGISTLFSQDFLIGITDTDITEIS